MLYYFYLELQFFSKLPFITQLLPTKNSFLFHVRVLFATPPPILGFIALKTKRVTQARGAFGFYHAATFRRTAYVTTTAQAAVFRRRNLGNLAFRRRRRPTKRQSKIAFRRTATHRLGPRAARVRNQAFHAEVSRPQREVDVVEQAEQVGVAFLGDVFGDVVGHTEHVLDVVAAVAPALNDLRASW